MAGCAGKKSGAIAVCGKSGAGIRYAHGSLHRAVPALPPYVMSDFAPLSTARRLVMGGGGAQPAFLGRFELQRVLGQGAQATVWLAQDPRLQRPVAIKLMPPMQGQDASEIGRAHVLT